MTFIYACVRGRRVPRKAVVSLFAALTIATSPTPTESSSALSAASSALQTQLDTKLTELVGNQAMQTPALQVAIAQNGRVSYDRAFGTASLKTRFPIGSITKMFVAVAIMQLVEANRIDLEAKVKRYLPTAPYANEITVRELLEHTSGLWNYGDYAFQRGLTATPTAPAAILALAAGHPLTSPPGTTWAYSNTGYVVLGLIVEKVSGEPLAQYERERIFQPAQMTETTMGNPGGTVPIAAGYMSAAGTRSAPYDPSWLFACGDIVSTAGDVARFDIALLDGRLLKPSTFAKMQSDVVGAESGMQGLGVSVISWRGLHFVGHHGGLPGYEAENETIPTQRVAWVVLSNAFDFATPRANRVVLGALFPGLGVPAASTTPEDRGVTERFRKALGDLMQGTIDRSEYSESANAALTSQLLAETAAQLKSLGGVLKITFAGAAHGAAGTVYSYVVTFAGGQTLTWQFILNSSGKIAGIGSTG
jgi:D-alanyl-D-alanine carboxypeptidase